MYIQDLKLVNFRNYSSTTFEFCNGINILVGNNAQGKTNCAEAIFYLCTGYSPKASNDKQVIKQGMDEGVISGSAMSMYGKVNVSITFSKSGKKIKVNEMPIKKIGELMGNINSVFFNPDDLKLIKNTPEDRRRFINISLSQMDRGYFFALQKYNKILEQRNALLKNPDRDLINETIPLWDEKLCECAEQIILKRINYIEKLSPIAKEIHSFITNGGENLEVLPDFSYVLDENNIKNNLKEALLERLEKDVILGFTGLGPHRDDLKIKVNGGDVRIYGSQGQQRTSALSLKLAELELFKERFNEYPVLILDDALSELDGERRNRLLSRISNIQTIITCTDFDFDISKFEVIKIMKIKGGEIVK